MQVRLSGWEIGSQRQISFQFRRYCELLPSRKLKTERQQKANLQEKQCAYFRDLCSRRHFESPEISTRNFKFGAEANISAWAEILHVMATKKYQPS